VLQRPRLDAGSLDERVDIPLLEPDHAPELVSGKLTVVDQAVQRARRDPQVPGCLSGPKPLNVFHGM